MSHKWTVMVYLASDNNLSGECVFAISEMKRSLLDKNVDVIVQLNTGVFDNVRLRISHGADSGKLKEELTRARADTRSEICEQRLKTATRVIHRDLTALLSAP